MGRQREETVGSYVKHKDVVTFTWEEDKGSTRWLCSCGEAGSWTILRPGALVPGWHQHIREAHPEVEL